MTRTDILNTIVDVIKTPSPQSVRLTFGNGIVTVYVSEHYTHVESRGLLGGVPNFVPGDELGYIR